MPLKAVAAQSPRLDADASKIIVSEDFSLIPIDSFRHENPNDLVMSAADFD